VAGGDEQVVKSVTTARSNTKREKDTEDDDEAAKHEDSISPFLIMKETKQQPDRRRVVCLPFIFFNLGGTIVHVVGSSRKSELVGVHSKRDERE
jgi:hypothetical protein